MEARHAEESSLLWTEFLDTFGRDPDFLITAPGRVNLIGEHTDYNGCPVLPMAIQYNIQIAAACSRDGRVSVINRDTSFPSRTFRLQPDLPPFTSGDWGNYVKAGMQTIIDYCTAGGESAEELLGADMLVSGSIPRAAGLSSSSALLVASALTLLAVNGKHIEPKTLAQLLAEGEKYVGTQGGGMDQAVSLLGRAGSAVKIDFNPLTVSPVPVPEGYSFLVADSGVKAEKSEAARDKYNTRTVECRIGTELGRMALCGALRRNVDLTLLGDLRTGNFGMSPDEAEETIMASLHPEGYSLPGLKDSLHLSPEQIEEKFLRRRDGSVMPEPLEGYKIFQRVRHILTESRRVEKSAEALEAGDMEGFGLLMTASHASCRDLFEISCPELDILVSHLLRGGALGARLTGAGFGGCAVALIPDRLLQRCINYVQKEYYRGSKGTLFACRPSSGAAVRSL